jgi:excisionase family DNA binding protein
MTTTNDSDVLTLDDAAAILKLSRRTIQNLISRGELRAYRGSQRIVRLFRSDLMDYLKRHSTLAVTAGLVRRGARALASISLSIKDLLVQIPFLHLRGEGRCSQSLLND